MPNLTTIQRFRNTLLTGQYQILILELFVVAAGIFIGFQVDRWYEQFQDSEKAEQYILRLLANIESDIANFDGASKTGKERRERTERVILSVGSDRVILEDPVRYLIDIRRSTMRFNAVSNDMTYRELQNTGDTALLPIEIREELYSYYNDIDTRAQFNSSLGNLQAEAYKRFAGILLPEHFNLVIFPPDFDRETLTFSNEDAIAAAERLRNNEDAVAWLGKLRDSHTQEENSSLRFLAEAQALKARLEAYLP